MGARRALIRLNMACCLVLANFVGWIGTSSASDVMDPGERYVELALALDRVTDGGYVFAYQGLNYDHDQATELISIDKIGEAAQALIATIDSTEARGIETERLAALRLRVAAMLAQIEVLKGKTSSFDDEASQIFGVRPPRYLQADADASLARIDRLLPGKGSLAERAAAFNERLKVQPERQEAVFRAALEACRERTLAYIDLPEGETIELVFADNLPAAGRYDYLGKYRGRVTVNRQTASISSALYLGCHEAYPGHHLRAILIEQQYGAYKWPEHKISTLFEPASLIDEGLGNYAVDLAFSDEEKLRLFREKLFPLAGLDPSDAERLIAFDRAMDAVLPYGTIEVSRAYLDGEIGRDEAVDLVSRYSLRPREEMSGMFGFVDSFRTFVVTYVLGEDLVRRRIGRAGEDPSSRWGAFQELSTELITPEMLGRISEPENTPTPP